MNIPKRDKALIYHQAILGRIHWHYWNYTSHALFCAKVGRLISTAISRDVYDYFFEWAFTPERTRGKNFIYFSREPIVRAQYE